MLLAETIVYAAGFYLLFGAAFGVWFAARGINGFDEAARGTGFGFRLITFFGAAAFWPLLARRLLGGEPRPAERTAHRTEAER